MKRDDQKPLTAAIIGTGFGGIGMAIKLQDAGITDFVVLEKADQIGGTWRDNTYPGAACDVPSPLYSFSFEQDFDWPRFYSRQPDIHRYQQHCVSKYGLMRYVRLNTEVQRASFDEPSGLWRIETSLGEVILARALITATGQLNRPSYPKISGLESFRGKVFHSARWDRGHDLAGRRVGVIGTGASAVQFMAPVVDKAAHVTLFQRTAPYVLPKPDRKISRVEHWLHRNVPPLRKLVRGTVYSVFESLGVGLLKCRPVLAPLKVLWTAHLRLTIKDPDLRRRLTPDYPIGCKRILFDNTYYRALAQPHVAVVTCGIKKVGHSHVVTDDGARHEIDTLILGTGFSASGFLAPMEVRGCNGLQLSAVWREGAEAYLGITVTGFPNLFMLYGPNTNLGHNSIVYMLESQIQYVREAVLRLRASPGTSFNVKCDTQGRFNQKLQHALRNTVWAEGCKSWYIAESGKIVNNWSSFTFAYRRLTRRFDVLNYTALTSRSVTSLIDNRLHTQSLETAALPVMEETFAAKVARMAVKSCLRSALQPAYSIPLQRLWSSIVTRTLAVPLGVRFARTAIRGVPTEIVRATATHSNSHRAVLFLHGGAFIIGSPRSHRCITARMAKLMGATVFVPNYRLAPEHPFPAALNDALACYRGILQQGYSPHEIALAGDSAGGGLVLSLCLRLRRVGLSQPACLALISPWVDLTQSQLAPVADDPLLRADWLNQGAAAYLQGRSAQEPLVSPVFADLAGLPRTLIHSGSEEILRNDSRRLAQTLTAAGVAVVHREFPRMWHDFQLYAGLVPEATRSVEDIVDFMRGEQADAIRSAGSPHRHVGVPSEQLDVVARLAS